MPAPSGRDTGHRGSSAPCHRDGSDALRRFLVDDDPLRVGLIDEVAQQFALRSRVDRHRDGTQLAQSPDRPERTRDHCRAGRQRDRPCRCRVPKPFAKRLVIASRSANVCRSSCQSSHAWSGMRSAFSARMRPMVRSPSEYSFIAFLRARRRGKPRSVRGPWRAAQAFPRARCGHASTRTRSRLPSVPDSRSARRRPA